jgi:tetratricopeptide (TPR) repeat protein
MVDSADDLMAPERSAPEPREAEVPPIEMACPVCERVVPLPAPQLCPHCQAPIESIVALLRVSDLSLEEAGRDLVIGDLDSVARRLELVRITSRRHRLRAEVLHAMLLRVKGEPQAALAKLRAAREKLEEGEEDIRRFIDKLEAETLADQTALAAACELHNFALFQAKRGHYEEARASLLKALDCVPHHAPSHALLGKVQLALRNTDEARYHFRRALASDPSNPTAARYLGRLGRPALVRPFLLLTEGWSISPRWAGAIIALVILAFIAIAALLSR